MVQIIRNQGNNVFTALDPVDDESNPILIAAGDVDNNGLDDPVTVSGQGNAFADGRGSVGVRLNETCIPLPPKLTVAFVDESATGDETGESWEDAFTDLRLALCRAAVSEAVEEIRVAQGTYTPARPDGDRDDAFLLVDGLRIYGGFPPGGGSFDERDPVAHPTVLSGDLNGDDAGGEGTGENSNNVVRASGVGREALLDGFTITGGNANIPIRPFDRGGGMYLFAASPLVRNCSFLDNTSVQSGAGIYIEGATPVFLHCEIRENQTTVDGPGPGGGANFIATAPTLINCLLAENHASGFAGAVATGQGTVAVLTNCTIAANDAVNSAPGVWATGGGGGVVLTNTILWGNGSGDQEQFVQAPFGEEEGGPAFYAINFSCVQGGTREFGGIGNLEDDPLFTEQEHRLLPESPCIDAAYNWGISVKGVDDPNDPLRLGAVRDEFDVDGDGDTVELIPLDIGGLTRFEDATAHDDAGCGVPVVIDMGAYEQATIRGIRWYSLT